MNKFHFKTFFLFLFILGITNVIIAQDTSNVDSAIVGKYVVKTFLNSDNTYGYTVYDEGNIILLQKFRNFDQTQSGFKIKSNALKMGIYITDSIVSKCLECISVPGTTALLISMDKAKNIGISSEDWW